MSRIATLDGLRGYFLVIMLVNHLTFSGGLGLERLTRIEFLLGVDAQGFVFLSGLLAGMVYTTRLSRHGFGASAARMRRRALEIYRYALFCLAIVLVLTLILPGASVFWTLPLGQIARPTAASATAAAAFLLQPEFMDILPQYVLYLLVAPPLVRLVAGGRWALVTGLSALSWMAVQLGAGDLLLRAVNAGLGALQPGLHYQSASNPFAWQMAFMAGLVLGGLTASGRIDWRRVMRPDRPELALAALCLVVVMVGVQALAALGSLPYEANAVWAVVSDRPTLGPALALSFAALAYLVGWLLLAGQDAGLFGAGLAHRLLDRVLNWSFLRLLGRHSLQVFVYHVVLVYLLMALEWRLGPWHELTKTALTLLAMASLAAPALLHESMAVRARPQGSIAG